MGIVRTTRQALAAIFIITGLHQLASGAEESRPVQNTVITSRHLEMQGTAEKNYFYFTGDVRVGFDVTI